MRGAQIPCDIQTVLGYRGANTHIATRIHDHSLRTPRHKSQIAVACSWIRFCGDISQCIQTLQATTTTPKRTPDIPRTQSFKLQCFGIEPYEPALHPSRPLRRCPPWQKYGVISSYIQCDQRRPRANANIATIRDDHGKRTIVVKRCNWLCPCLCHLDTWTGTAVAHNQLLGIARYSV